MIDLTFILRVIDTWQARLWLEHWDIEIDWDEPADSDAHAQIRPHARRKQATLQLEEDWEQWSVEHANWVIAHELLHCSHRDVDAVLAIHLSGGLLSSAAEALVDEAYEVAMERYIDDQARILVQGFGLVQPASSGDAPAE